MQNRLITIATAKSSRSVSWKNKELQWSSFVDQLRNSTQTRETLKEFIQSNKEEQHAIKDVGGYVGGYLRGGKRSPSTVGFRQVLTLDVDFANSDFFGDFTMLYDCAAFIHATHKHSALEPRYRLLIPIDRECSPDEYVAIARRVAGNLGIERFDNTTFETNRLMFWPSHPRDVEYYCEEQVGEFLNADEVLASYIDWRDTSLWPTAEKKIREIGDSAKKQEDPALKRGIVGTFCRTYGIDEAIEKFLPNEYTPTVDGRYTYTGGSTASGLITYDNTFAFSHHGTDPASGKLCNAFDLVRLHKYSHLDTNGKGNKSFAAMEALATADKEVRLTLARENLDEAKELFPDLEGQESTAVDLDWMALLEIDSKNSYLSTANNLNLIFANDKHLAGAFKFNEFSKRISVMRSVPWRKVTAEEPMVNVDYSGIRNYIECVYGIASQGKIDDSFILESARNSYHPVRDYLNSLSWEGELRIDRLFIDCFGVEDTPYHRETARKMLCGAVARIFRPGCKFDYMAVLVGPEGWGKSSILKKLGGAWFSDTFLGVQGTQAYEQLQNVWIMEIGELAGFKKADGDAVKMFVSKGVDSFRPAYGRTKEDYPRQCVFWGSTNKVEFLKSLTGDRRFWPISIERKITTEELEALPVDQLWAEAVFLYQQGEKLYLSEEAEALARAKQIAHREVDERLGLIQAYLDKKLPANWKTMEVFERQTFASGDEEGTTDRRYVCTAEIWCECLGKAKNDMTKYATKELNEMLRTLPDWQAHQATKTFTHYGKQRYYERLF